MQTIKIIISGKVQGVFFRDFIKEQADILEIKGFTKNISDGNVEIIAQGSESALKELIEQTKIGHAFAKIDKINVSHETSNTIFKDFKIIY